MGAKFCRTCGTVVDAALGAEATLTPMTASGQPITCPSCHAQVHPGLRFCPHCGADTADAPERAVPAPAAPVTGRAPIDARGYEGLATVLWVLGCLFGAVGFYYLVLAPGEADSSLLERGVVNLHRLALGLAGSTGGAVFLSAAAIVTALNRHLEVTAKLAARGFAFYLEDREGRAVEPPPG
jgi:hypothetical protein